jgi:hypothetical protein
MFGKSWEQLGDYVAMFDRGATGVKSGAKAFRVGDFMQYLRMFTEHSVLRVQREAVLKLDASINTSCGSTCWNKVLNEKDRGHYLATN